MMADLLPHRSTPLYLNQRWRLPLGAGALVLAVALAFVHPIYQAIAAGLIVFCFLIALARHRPNAALAVWVVLVAIVPPWQFYFGITPAMIVSAAIILGRRGMKGSGRNFADWAVLGVVVVCASGNFLGVIPNFLARVAALQWGLCYWSGRRLIDVTTDSIGRIMTTLGTVLSAIAIPQAFLGFNLANLGPYQPFTLSGADWRVLATRGGFTRATVTFGQPIALGAVLVLCLAFSIRAPLTRGRTLTSMVILGGIFCTFSRGPLLAAALVILLTILFGRWSPSAKLFYSVLCAGPVLFVGAFFASTVNSTSASSIQTAASGTYREHLLQLVSLVKVFGLASGGVSTGTQQTVTFNGTFNSIDNGLLFMGLYVGAIGAFFYLFPSIYVLIQAVRHGWRTVDIAFMGQTLILFTVAPITQYENFYWLFAGLAVSRYTEKQIGRTRERAALERAETR